MRKKDKTPLGYDWIIQDIRSIEEGSNFLDCYTHAIGNSLSVYEDTPLYKYYYRFLTPIRYQHPSIKGCEDSFWGLFFQLVFAEGKRVKLLQRENSLPELSFSFPGYHRIKTSTLSKKELKQITSDLAAQAFTKTGVELLEVSIDEVYALTLPSDRPPLRLEFIQLYGYGDYYERTPPFVKSFYRRIRDYDLQTFEYRLLNID